MKKIVKSFGANDVLKSVDFSLGEGEICALLGENGAGKSTLMNILGGVLQPDSGTIELDGKPVSFAGPAQSLGAGIAFIHQELNLINDLPVYENMFIGRELKKRSGFLDHAAMYQKTKELFERMGLDIDPGAMVSTLDASFKQIVEIARALMMNASIIIMDEPTTSLTDPEIERVFDMLRTLRRQRVGVVFISHKLREVMEICDRYTVLRDGVMVASGFVKDTSTAELARHMVGHEVTSRRRESRGRLGAEVLRLEKLTQEPHFRNVSLSVRAGEVLGVTGLLGDGRSELFRAVFGAQGHYEGQIYLHGNAVTMHSTQQALSPANCTISSVSFPPAVAIMMSSRSLSRSGSTTWVSGSPKRQLYSMTFGPFSVIIRPKYRQPRNSLPSFFMASMVGRKISFIQRSATSFV